MYISNLGEILPFLPAFWPILNYASDDRSELRPLMAVPDCFAGIIVAASGRRGSAMN
jgi:hypothetical protein